MPAPIITLGFEGWLQEVIDGDTTGLVSSKLSPSTVTRSSRRCCASPTVATGEPPPRARFAAIVVVVLGGRVGGGEGLFDRDRRAR